MKIWIAALWTAALLAGQASAAEVWSRQAQALETDRLEELARGHLDGVSIAPELSLGPELAKLAQRGLASAGGLLGAALERAGLLLALILLCSLADTAGKAAGAAALPDPVTLAGTGGIVLLTAGDVNSLLGMGRQTLEQMDVFSKALLPAVAAATAGSGAVSGAAVRQAGTTFLCDLCITWVSRGLLPLTCAYVAACAIFAAVGNEGVKEAAAFLKWLVTAGLTLLLLGFTGYLTLSGAAASGLDAMSVKAARAAISGMVPVVGSTLSGAAETVLSGACVLKNSIGLFGVLAILAFCLLPFLRLGIYYLVFKVTAAAAAALSGGRLGWLVGSLGSAFGLMLGMTGACALMLLISLTSSILVTVP